MAIKLMGVAESPSTTQDFVLINHPVFFVRNAADYVDMQTASNPVRFFFSSFNPFRFRLHQGMIALAIADQKVRNALNIRYWSMTPSRFGEGACKFSARPAGGPSAFVGTDKPDFLHANLADHLASTGASFDFMVQLRTRPGAMPIEDPTIVWNETDAPFTPIASITIPPQDFDSPEQHAFCENLRLRRGTASVRTGRLAASTGYFRPCMNTSRAFVTRSTRGAARADHLQALGFAESTIAAAGRSWRRPSFPYLARSYAPPVPGSSVSCQSYRSRSGRTPPRCKY